MSNVYLAPISKENWYEVATLPLTNNQSQFIESNALSLVQQQFEPTLQTYAITANTEIVGFMMYNRRQEELNGYWIYRIMIRAEHVRKGYAKQALKLVITEMKQLGRNPLIIAGIHRKNDASMALFTSVGFFNSGHHFGDEIAFILPSNNFLKI